MAMMNRALRLLLASIAVLLFAGAAAAQAQPQATPGTTAHSPAVDSSLADLLASVRSTAQKADTDIGRLRIDRWKTDAASRKQAQSSADSIQRNLTSAVPELLDHVHAAPNSLIANFRLYRDLNALYDTLSALTEAAGAFAPAEQYTALGTDLNQLDQARQKLADRVDFLVGSNEAELARLRAHPSTAAPAQRAPAATNKIVVDDNAPAKKKRKAPAQPTQPQP